MKIAFSTSGHDLEAPLDVRFGRATRFLILDEERGTFDLVDNAQNLHAAQGAGVQAAQHVVGSGAAVLISGHCGPKAFRVLQAGAVQVFTSDAPTLREALDLYRKGALIPQNQADVEGHWV